MVAPKPVARHIVVSAQPVLPTPEHTAESTLDPTPVYNNPPRQVYPKELLKHRFMPYGSETPVDKTVDDMDVDVEGTMRKDVLPEEPSMQMEKPSTKRKKRKGDVEATPKKSKRARRAS